MQNKYVTDLCPGDIIWLTEKVNVYANEFVYHCFNVPATIIAVERRRGMLNIDTVKLKLFVNASILNIEVQVSYYRNVELENMGVVGYIKADNARALIQD